MPCTFLKNGPSPVCVAMDGCFPLSAYEVHRNCFTRRHEECPRCQIERRQIPLPLPGISVKV